MPHARVLSAFEGHAGGRIIVASLGDDPAAGAEISVTVPGRAVWQVHSVSAEFVASATAANRRPSFVVDDGQRILWRASGSQAHTANLTMRYSMAPGASETTSTGAGVATLSGPPLVLLPGWRIRTITTNIESDDNWGAPVLYVTEIPERGEGVWDEMASALRREILDRREFNG